MHRSSGVMAIVGVLAALAVVETVGMHVVLMQSSTTAAIVSTVLSAYTLLSILGMAHAMRLSPLRFIGDELVIERGFRARIVVPRAQIAEATPIAAKLDGTLDLSYFDPNVVVTLRSPVVAHGLFGRTRTADRVLLTVDDRDGFLATLSSP
jgi:hypothetical protein